MHLPIHTLLARTAHVQQNYLRPHLNKLGLSPGQPKVLRCLDAYGTCSQKELADCCEVVRCLHLPHVRQYGTGRLLNPASFRYRSPYRTGFPHG